MIASINRSVWGRRNCIVML